MDRIWDAFWSGGISNPLNDLRWSRFKHFAPAEMYTVVSEHVFPFLRTLGGDDSTYAGVSTAILLFTKTNSGGTDHVWFYDVDADGWKLYADCLEQRFGQRPLIFYSNGYDHWVWDDTSYPPRAIQSDVPRLRLRQHDAADRQHEHAAARRGESGHPPPRLPVAGALGRQGNLHAGARQPAKEALAGFLAGKTLTANQIEFVNLVVNHLTEHGVMDAKLLYESPFTNLTPRGPDGLFTSGQVDELIRILDSVRATAQAA